MKRWLEQLGLPVLVVIVGLLSSIGFVSGSPVVQAIGSLTAASPLPIPFTDIAGTQHNFAYQYSVTATTRDGSVVTQPVTLRSFIGPHRRTVVYEIAGLLYQQSPFLMTTVLASACHGKPLLQGLPAPTETVSLTFTMMPPQATTTAQTIHIVCPGS